MTQNELNELIDKVHEGRASKEELYRYNVYLNHLTAVNENLAFSDLESEESIKSELFSNIEKNIKSGAVRSFQMRSYLAVAASIAIAVVAGIWLYTAGRGTVDAIHQSPIQADILPGRSSATLTLANGKTIRLSDAKTELVVSGNKLVYSDGSAVTSSSMADDVTSAGHLMTIATPRGGTYQAILPDGTKIWLNSASDVSFPKKFTGSERNVELNGEAYFEVAKNKQLPFVVRSRGQKVTVIGTHFNINSYSDEPGIKTTLVEGSISVGFYQRGKNGEREDRRVMLKPNQKSVLIGDDITIRQANVEEDLAWRNGYFLFDNENVKSIMRKVSRWYDVEIRYEGNVENKALWGSMSRYKQVSEVLEMLSATKAVRFEIQGRVITVLPAKAK